MLTKISLPFASSVRLTNFIALFLMLDFTSPQAALTVTSKTSAT
jgi:hypothetical protein